MDLRTTSDAPGWPDLVAVVFVATLLIASATSALPFTLNQTFDDPTVTTNDQFGKSVAIDGDNVLIGAHWDSTNGTNVGQAHLFDAISGNLVQTFDDPTVTTTDGFGYSVAIDGNDVLIGARWDHTNGRYVGQAHLFDAVSGNLLQTFDDPTIPGFDEFGTSVAIGGNNVFIGAPDDDTIDHDIGQAHLFDAISGNLVQTFDDPTVTTKDYFGISVAINGNNLLIGSLWDDTNGHDIGQAHLFDTVSGNLLQTFDDPTVTDGDWFGRSVAIDGNNVLVGAPADDTNGTDVGQAYLFDATIGNLLQTFDDPTATTQDRFGTSVGIDGNKVLIGAPEDDTNGTNVGQVHLFDATSGSLLQTFHDPAATAGGLFGDSVAIEGNNILIGAPGNDTNGEMVGRAYLFTPEPASLLLLLTGTMLMTRRRRKR